MRYMKKTYTMQYSLYDLYKDCSLDLYEIRNHFLDRFYYQDHSRNNARDVMRIVVSSSKTLIPQHFDLTLFISS